jgi:peptidoglycan/LPS O-acetylase OafA/YrhL
MCYRKPWFIEFLRQHKVACWTFLSVMILFTSFAPLVAYGLGGVVNHFWFAMLYGLFLILIVVFPESGLGSVMRQRWLVWLGLRSYFIYLAHEAASGLLHGAIFAGEPRISSPFELLVTIMSLMAVLFLASVSYRYFELPFLSYGRKIPYSSVPLTSNR